MSLGDGWIDLFYEKRGVERESDQNRWRKLSLNFIFSA